MKPPDGLLADLVERITEDHVAWVNGDSSGYEFHDETSTILGLRRDRVRCNDVNTRSTACRDPV